MLNRIQSIYLKHIYNACTGAARMSYVCSQQLAVCRWPPQGYRNPRLRNIEPTTLSFLLRIGATHFRTAIQHFACRSSILWPQFICPSNRAFALSTPNKRHKIYTYRTKFTRICHPVFEICNPILWPRTIIFRTVQSTIDSKIQIIPDISHLIIKTIFAREIYKRGAKSIGLSLVLLLWFKVDGTTSGVRGYAKVYTAQTKKKTERGLRFESRILKMWSRKQWHEFAVRFFKTAGRGEHKSRLYYYQMVVDSSPWIKTAARVWNVLFQLKKNTNSFQ